MSSECKSLENSNSPFTLATPSGRSADDPTRPPVLRVIAGVEGVITLRP
jgi:hypothetical protein